LLERKEPVGRRESQQPSALPRGPVRLQTPGERLARELHVLVRVASPWPASRLCLTPRGQGARELAKDKDGAFALTEADLGGGVVALETAR
jgi:hypothetical protein